MDTAGEGIGTSEFYVNQGVADATVSDKLTFTGEPAGFRRHYTSGQPLDTFIMMAGINPNATQSNLYVDDIHISSGENLGYMAKSPIGYAFNPDPSSGATDVGTAAGATVNVQLKWKTGLDPCDINNPDPNITMHKLFYGPNDPNLEKGTVISVNVPSGYPTVDPNGQYLVTGLDYNQLYHWRVDEIGGSVDPCQGTVWSFTTKGQYPEVTVHPSDVLSEDPCVVQFSVEVQSATTAHFIWKKSTDAQVGGDTTVGTDSNVLTLIANDSNEAFYYCVVSNEGSGGTDTSDIAGLWLKKQAGRWKLNNDLTDATGNGYTAAWDSTGDPCTAHQVFDACALEGSHSVIFYDDPNAFLSVPNSEDYFDHYVRGLTVSCWVKVEPGATGWEAIVAKQSRSTSTTGMHGWVLELNSGTPVFQVRNVDVRCDGPGSIADANWHMLTARYNYYESNAGLYIDGELTGYDGSISRDNVVKTTLDPVTIGAEDANAGAAVGDILPFNGYVDDVRIWTYPLSGVDIAALYMDDYSDYYSKGSICVNGDHPAYDYNGDCQVNFADLATFAATWLECNLYPTSACNE
jgi:hypothetical protein